jgi:hypothetical protein
VFWDKGLDDGAGGSPPDCSSPDGDAGIGWNRTEEGEERYDVDGTQTWIGSHNCETCALNQFGSADKGDGKACKEVRMLFLLQPGEILPMAVALPPTSLRPATAYFLRLAQRGISYHQVETEISLEAVKGQFPYAVATFKALRKLDEDELARLAALREQLTPMLAAVSVRVEDLEGSEGS